MKTARYLSILMCACVVNAASTVTVEYPQATVLGTSSNGIDSFRGIPFAQPPVGRQRLRAPKPIKGKLGVVDATGQPRSCPQFASTIDTSNVPEEAAKILRESPGFSNEASNDEDCLTMTVQRPSSATSGSKLPVVFWIYGGGFETGAAASLDASDLIAASVKKGYPIIYVAVNYRLGGWGFLPGKEVLKDGVANLGLLDQRMGLEWNADNIEAFGGDPDKVTIWGESAGSISVFDQMVLYDGNNTYKGKPLFRAALMNSGSVIPSDPVDCPKGQLVYDTVVERAGCSTAQDTLDCLRSLPFDTFRNAVNSFPTTTSYYSVSLFYLPRPDAKTLTDSPEVLIRQGKYTKVPYLIVAQEDEGTVLAILENNITTSDALVTYLQTIFFPNVPPATIAGLAATYPNDPAAGSPFRTGILYNVYPQYKRLAAILGDIVFTLTRRLFIDITNQVSPNVPSWSALASYDHIIPILGTLHASDIPHEYGQIKTFASYSIQAYYISFFNTMDPNKLSGGLTHWPVWGKNRDLLHFQALSNGIIRDDFRNESYAFLSDRKNVIRI